MTALAEGGSLVLPWNPHPAAHSTPIVVLTKVDGRLSGPFVREAAFMRDRGQRAGELPFPGLGRPPTPVGTLPVGSVDLIGSGMMTQLLLMMPGVRVGTGVRPFQGGHGRIVWMGVGESWAYVWPDGSVTGEGERALGSELADAYRRLSDAGLPSLSAFSLEVDPDRDSYKVECALIGRRWNHPID